MAKSLFEELGGKYERQGDYLIPCLTVPAEEEQAIGIWGQRHLDYLKQYRKVTYTNLLLFSNHRRIFPNQTFHIPVSGKNILYRNHLSLLIQHQLLSYHD